MTTIDPTTEAVVASSDAAAEDSRIGALLAAIADWATSTDHKKIGRLFLGGGLLGLLATVVVGVIIGVQRADIATVDAGALPQLFDAHRVGLVFGTLLPLGVGLAVAAVPLQVGARAIAFPRLAAAGFWMWFGGLVLVVISLAGNGGGLGGDANMVDLFLASLGLMAVGAAAAAGSVATTVLSSRAPGMSMRRVPFFSMSAMLSSLGILLVMPALVGTLTYLFLDHRNSREGFGGNVGLYEWAFWVFTTPTVFLFALPAIGVMAEGAPLMFRTRIALRGVVFAGFALVASAAFAGVAQQNLHNVAWDGPGASSGDAFNDALPWALFNLLPLLGLVIVFLMTLLAIKPVKGSRPNVTPAFAFGFLGSGMILVGMLGSVLNAIDDLELQGTLFEEGALVYVAYGAALATLGGIAHWAPKWWGRVLPVGAVLPLAALGLLATVLASLPNYIAGFDEPRTIYAVLVLVGHVLMGLTVLAFVGLLVTTVTGSGDQATDDPYDGQTLEWATTSPAPRDNFVDPPTVSSAEPLLDLKPATTTGSDA